MTPLDWHILAAVHGRDLSGLTPWAVSDLATVTGVTVATVRRRVSVLSSMTRREMADPPKVTLGHGDIVRITDCGREMMSAAAEDPRLDQSVRPFRDAVLSGSVEVSTRGGTTLRPVPYSRAVLPTGGTRGGRKGEADTIALMDIARPLGMSVDVMLDRLREGKIKVCRQCGPRPSEEFEKGRRFCKDCRRDADKARRPGRYRG